MADHLDADLRVETLAERAGMSLRTFARTYAARTGMTPAKSVEVMRVEAAKRLLQQDYLSVASVALRVGFKDLERMRRAFLRHMGTSPAEYRRRFAVSSTSHAVQNA
jgi:transcriptional regulator GlxA family with amidase domain